MTVRMPGMVLGTARSVGDPLDVLTADLGPSRLRLVGFALVLGSGTVLNAMGVRGGNARKSEGAYELSLVSIPPTDASVQVIPIGGGTEIRGVLDASTVKVVAVTDSPFLLLVTAPVATPASIEEASAPPQLSLPSATPTEPNHGG